MSAPSCDLCHRELGATRKRWHSDRCASVGQKRESRGAKRESRGAQVDAPVRERHPPPALGAQVGAVTVVGFVPRTTHRMVVVVYPCGHTTARTAWELRNRPHQQCGRLGCQKTGHAGRVAWAVRGTCSWCLRPVDHTKPYECRRCERQACRRGRDAEGRPLVTAQGCALATRPADGLCLCGCGRALVGKQVRFRTVHCKDRVRYRRAKELSA